MVGRDEIPATGQRVSIPGRHDNANEIVLIMQMDHQHTAWKWAKRTKWIFQQKPVAGAAFV